MWRQPGGKDDRSISKIPRRRGGKKQAGGAEDVPVQVRMLIQSTDTLTSQRSCPPVRGYRGI